MPVVGDAEGANASGDPVGRVNLPDEPDLQLDPSDLSDDQPNVPVAAVAADSMREKVLFGLMAVVMMILAMVVILQGVFEQKMPI